MVRVGILALQGDVAEHRRGLADAGAEAVSVRRPADLDGVDGLVLPGGESTTVSMLLDSSGLAAPLTRAVRDGMPMFGTCAGMILLASSADDGRPDQRLLGAIDIRVRRNGYGRQAQSFECDLAVDEIDGGPVHAVFIRAPVVVSAGPGVDVLARLPGPGPGTGSAPVVCRQGHVLVSAFHPELTADRRVHQLFLSMIGARSGAGPGVAALVGGDSGRGRAIRGRLPG